MDLSEYQRHYQVEQDHWWFQGARDIYRALLDGVEGELSSGPSAPRILDIGCGTGYTSEWLRQFGSVTPLDVSSEALRWSRSRNLKQLVQGDASQLPFSSGSFDVVACLGVIEHVANDQQLLSEANRVTRPGGWLLLLTSAYQFLWSHHDLANHHYRRYTRTQLGRLLEQDAWTCRNLSYMNTLLFLPILCVRFFERLTGADRRKTSRDLEMPQPLINRVFRRCLSTEARWIPKHSLPFGVSLVCLVRRHTHEK